MRWWWALGAGAACGIGYLVSYAFSSSSCKRPCVCAATWEFGLIAVKKADEMLNQRLYGLVDVLEKAVNAVELDNAAQYFVGYGGLPNSEGDVECDAAIMRGDGRVGCVGALQNICTPVSVARAVMDHSPHNVIVGAGALKFARSMCFTEDPDRLLTEGTVAQWREWQKAQQHSSQVQAGKGREAAAPVDDSRQSRPQHLMASAREVDGLLGGSASELPGAADEQKAKMPRNHDTIGMVACNPETGEVAAAVSTSGWAFKHPGRLGDVPLIGCGFYAVNGIGAAVATGDGEKIMKSCLSFLTVELMRGGCSAQRACEAAIDRLLSQPTSGGDDGKHHKVICGILALSAKGEKGAATTIDASNPVDMRTTFPHAVCYSGMGGQSLVQLEHVVRVSPSS